MQMRNIKSLLKCQKITKIKLAAMRDSYYKYC